MIRTRFTLFVFLFCLPLTLKGQDSISRDPPPEFQAIEPILTPLEQAVSEKNGDTRTPQASQLRAKTYREILRETVVIVDEKKRTTRAEHLIMEAISDSGVQAVKEATFSFSKTLFRPHIALARTIQENGEEDLLRDGGTFIQTPQRWAQHSLYDDQGELKIIFPRVKKGSIIECIVVFEELEQIADEFGHTVRFWGGHSGNRRRFVIDLPDTVADQISISERGVTKSPVLKNVPEGRRRFVWELENVPFPSAETNGPSVLSLVPQVRISSFKSWDEVASWYRKLSGGVNGKLPGAVLREVEKWIPKNATQTEIVNILLEKVANDIRYTGLEFGVSAIKPNSPEEVWDAGYGDCKDKSNLLRVLLQHYNIPSYLTLVRSQSYGAIEKEAPHFGAFDHCILAVEDDKGNLDFCDPTDTNARVNILPIGDSGREVFVVTNDGGKWIRTPMPDGYTNRYAFDYKLESDQSFSGKLNYEGRGQAVLSAIKVFKEGTAIERRLAGSQFVSALIPNTRTPEINLTEANIDTQTLSFNAYVIRTTDRKAHSNLQERDFEFGIPGILSFAPLVPENGARDRSRKDVYRQIGRREAMSGSIQLPDGYTPKKIPPPYSLRSKWLFGDAYWSYSSATNKLTLVARTIWQVGDIPPEDFPSFAASAREFRKWLSQSIPIHQSSTPPLQLTNLTPLSNFTVLSDGDSQLALVDYRYPRNGDAGLRRTALQRTSELFPKDRLTQFRCELELAILDLDKDPEKVIKRLQNVLKEDKGRIPVLHYAEAEGIFAKALSQTGRHEEAFATFERLSQETQLTNDVREWLILNLARESREVNQYEKAHAALETSLQWRAKRWQATFAEWAVLSCEVGKEEDVKTWLLKQASINTEETLQLCQLLLTYVDNLNPKPSEAAQIALSSVFLEISTGETEPEIFSDALSQLINRQGVNSRQNEEAGKLIAEIKEGLKKKYSFYTSFVGADAPIEEARKKTMEADQAGDSLQAVRYVMGIFRDFEANSQSRGDIANAAIMLNRVLDEGGDKSGEELLDKLLVFLRNEPRGTHYWYHAHYHTAKASLRRKEWDQVEQTTTKVLQHETSEAPEEWQDSFRLLLADSQAGQMRFDEAIASYLKINPKPWTDTKVEIYVRALNTAAHVSDRKSALEFVEILRQTPETFRDSESFNLIREFVDQPNENLIKYWDKMDREWWPQWVRFASGLDMDVEVGKGNPVPDYRSIVRLNDRTVARSQEELLHGFSIAAKICRWNPAFIPIFYPYTLDIYNAPVPAMQRLAFRKVIIDGAKDIPFPGSNVRAVGSTMAALFLAQNSAFLKSVEELEESRELVAAVLKENDFKDGDLNSLRPSLAFTQLIIAGQFDDYTRQAIDFVETLLIEIPMFRGRADLVSTTLNLMKKNPQFHDAIPKFAERELKNPEVQRNSALTQLLKESRDQFGDPEGQDDLKTFFSEWIKTNQPEWWDYASPKTLEEAIELIATVPEAPSAPSSVLAMDDSSAARESYEKWITVDANYPDAVKAKALGLYAMSDQVSEKERSAAFNAAISTLSNQTDSPGLQSLINSRHLDYRSRTQLKTRSGNRQSISPPLSNQNYDNYLGRMQARRPNQPGLTSEALEKSIVGFLEDESIEIPEEQRLDEMLRNPTLHHIQVFLEYSDRLARAEIPVHRGPAKWKLKVMQLKNRYSKILEVSLAYQKQWIEVFPDLTAKVELEHLTGPDRYIAERWNQISEYLESIRAGEIPHHDSGYATASSLLRRTGKPEYVELAAQSYLTVAPHLRQPYQGIGNAFDLDIPLHREIFRNWFESNRPRVENDYQIMGMVATLKVKSGENLLALDRLTEFQRISYLISTEDKERLTKEIADIDPTILLSDAFLPLTLEAYRLIGSQKEINLVENAIAETIPHLVTRLWSGERSRDNLRLLAKSMRRLKMTSKDLPAQFVTHLPDPLETELVWDDDTAYGRSEWFALHNNWKGVVELGEQAHLARPTTTDWMAILIEAYNALGNREKVIHFGKLYRESGRGLSDYPAMMSIVAGYENELPSR